MTSRGRWVMAGAGLLTLVLAGYRVIPNVAGFGSLIDTFAPWLGLGVPILILIAILQRAPLAVATVLVPALAWVLLFGGAWLPGPDGTARLTVASQNLLADNPDPGATVRELVADEPDLIALQEVTPQARETVAGALRAEYPQRVTASTVGLWSRYPIRSSRAFDTGLGWRRALRAEVELPEGLTAVYVVHLGSLRPGETALRDRTITQLASLVRVDPAERLIVLGDFNTASTDRAFGPLADQLTDAQADAGMGPGFTWPAVFPVVRLDHVLYRGLDAVAADTPRTPGSDHRAVTAAFA